MINYWYLRFPGELLSCLQQDNMYMRKTLHMPLIHAYVWITEVMEHVSRKLSGAGKKCQEPLVMRNTYRSIFSIAVQTLQTSVVNITKETLLSDVINHKLFLKQLVMFQCETEEDRLGSYIRAFTFIARYSSFHGYCIALKLDRSQKYVFPWIGQVNDCYIGFCNEDRFQYFNANIMKNIGRQCKANHIDSWPESSLIWICEALKSWLKNPIIRILYLTGSTYSVLLTHDPFCISL